MNKAEEIREYIVQRLTRDLIGPMNPEVHDEVLIDYPSDKYLTGILYSRQSAIPQEEDDELAGGQNGDDDDSQESIPLSQCIRPASAGMSFVLQRIQGSGPVEFSVKISGAKYSKRWISDDGKSLTEEPRKGKENVRWLRTAPEEATLTCYVTESGQKTNDLVDIGFGGLELYRQENISGNEVMITAILINHSDPDDERDKNEQNAWFQTSFSVTPGRGCNFIGRIFRGQNFSKDDQTAALIYRDVLEYAQGHTCSATWETGKDGVVTLLRTTWIPISVVESFSAKGDQVFDSVRNQKTLKPFSASWLGSATKDELVSALKLVPSSYELWMENHEETIKSLPSKLKPFAQYHRELWKNGSARMLGAISTLEKDPNVLKAFQLSNRAMAMQRKWSRNENDLIWRPFQLAFVLLVFESVLNKSHKDRDVMDLLWFPTGGGKTEAYLAVIAMLLFYRRLNQEKEGKGAGVAVIMRYTLRVLTTQQFDRAANLICACEYLRLTENLNVGGEPFSIGLWIGGTAIPNEISKAIQDPDQRAMQIRKCPCCHEPLALGSSTASYEIYCRNNSCFFGKSGSPLPVWTVDEDVYNKLPSLIIGTIDKFAQIARNASTGKLFGIGTRHNPPDLIIQDELHLISGPLGTLAGLYETAIDVFCMQNEHPVKVIGSTATIKMADRQVKDLFNRRLFQFPPPGIDSDNSCFAVRDETRPGRLYIGVTTAGRSAKFTLQAVCASLLQSGFSTDIPANHEDSYWTLVTYFNSLRELGGAHVLLLDDVPKSIREYSYRYSETPRKINEPAELTSRLSQAEIPKVLSNLGETRKSGLAEDVLLCTT